MVEELDVGMKCIKYMLFVANFMIMMIGFLLISIGSTIKAIYEDFDLFVEAHYFSPAALAVAIGVIMFFVALFGCIGGCKESTFLVNIFSFLLMIILVLEISAAIAAYAMRGEIRATVQRRMQESMQDYYLDEDDGYIRGTWDFTQERLHCCGVYNSSDWDPYSPTTTAAPTTVAPTTVAPTTVAPTTIVPPKPETKPQPIEPETKPQPIEPETQPQPIEPERKPDQALILTKNYKEAPPLGSAWMGPSSCCSRPHKKDNEGQCVVDRVWKAGCLDNLTYIVSECALLLGCGTLAVTFIQILAIVFARMLAKAIRRIKTQSLVENQQNRQRLYEQLARGGSENNKDIPVLYTAGNSEC